MIDIYNYKYLFFLRNDHPALVGVVKGTTGLIYPFLILARLDDTSELATDLFFLVRRKDRNVALTACPVNDDILRSNK